MLKVGRYTYSLQLTIVIKIWRESSRRPNLSRGRTDPWYSLLASCILVYQLHCPNSSRFQKISDNLYLHHTCIPKLLSGADHNKTWNTYNQTIEIFSYCDCYLLQEDTTFIVLSSWKVPRLIYFQPVSGMWIRPLFLDSIYACPLETSSSITQLDQPPI